MPKSKLPPRDFRWSPELAYIVGLLVTDGNLSKDGRHITFRSSEKQLLSTFNRCLNLKNKIGYTPNQRGYRIQFSGVQFYNWLLGIGLFPRKTYTIGAVEIPDIFFRDFMRGHLDGDGSISAYEDRYNVYRGRRYRNQRIFVRLISASENHIKWLYGKITDLANVGGALIKNKPQDEKRVPMWEIKLAKGDSIKFLKWIYYKNTLPCLKRKRHLAENAIKKINKEKRRRYSRIQEF